MDNEQEGMQILEIWETEDEKRLSIDELRRFYKEFARNNFRQHPYINKHTNWKIRVSAQGIGEIRKFRKREHIIMVRILDIILKDSILCEVVPEEKNTPGIENVSYFRLFWEYSGKPEKVLKFGVWKHKIQQVYFTKTSSGSILLGQLQR